MTSFVVSESYPFLRVSESYPFLSLARRYNMDYGDMLCLADVARLHGEAGLSFNWKGLDVPNVWERHAVARLWRHPLSDRIISDVLKYARPS